MVVMGIPGWLRGATVSMTALLWAPSVLGAPGTHAPAISTWDTRASSLEFGFRPGFLSGGHFDVLSYNANFTATSGNLSSQFGLHYINFRPGEQQSVLHGLGATAVAVFSNPLGSRYDSGIPRSALGVYFGAAPTALVNGRTAFVSLPLLIGLGVPWAPSESVTITPWVEGSPGLNLDTQINTATVDLTGVGATVTGTQQNPSVSLSDAAVSKILDQTVSFKSSFTLGMRAGLDLSFKLGESVDLDVSGAVGSLGGAFHGTTVGWVGGGLVFRWDKVVPAVLSPERRLQGEDCADIEARHRACGAINGPVSTPRGGYAPRPASAPTYSAPQSYTPAPAYSPPPPAPTPGTPTPGAPAPEPQAAPPAMVAPTTIAPTPKDQPATPGAPTMSFPP